MIAESLRLFVSIIYKSDDTLAKSTIDNDKIVHGGTVARPSGRLDKDNAILR
jgi:hypothetical protein